MQRFFEKLGDFNGFGQCWLYAPGGERNEAVILQMSRLTDGRSTDTLLCEIASESVLFSCLLFAHNVLLFGHN